MSYASAVRSGVSAASRLHRDLGFRTRVTHRGGQIDVSEAASTLGLAVLFRPLEGLLGAFLNIPSPGALITTKRPLAVQRMTLAHELGHFVLKHSPSLDDENILRRAAVPNSGVHDQEFAADAFAYEFMLPRWLLQFHCQAQGWMLDDLRNPATVYQLSLRVGASYEATCRTLFRHKLLLNREVERLLAATPRSLKKSLLGDYDPPDFRSDVWLLTKRDDRAAIDGSQHDLFVLSLEEHSASGYLWAVADSSSSQLSIVDDNRAGSESNSESVGDHVKRTITTRSETRQRGHLTLTECRPWLPDDPLNQLHLQLDLMGPEEGMSQFERRQMFEAA